MRVASWRYRPLSSRMPWSDPSSQITTCHYYSVIALSCSICTNHREATTPTYIRVPVPLLAPLQCISITNDLRPNSTVRIQTKQESIIYVMKNGDLIASHHFFVVHTYTCDCVHLLCIGSSSKRNRSEAAFLAAEKSEFRFGEPEWHCYALLPLNHGATYEDNPLDSENWISGGKSAVIRAIPTHQSLRW